VQTLLFQKLYQIVKQIVDLEYIIKQNHSLATRDCVCDKLRLYLTERERRENEKSYRALYANGEAIIDRGPA